MKVEEQKQQTIEQAKPQLNKATEDLALKHRTKQIMKGAKPQQVTYGINQETGDAFERLANDHSKMN